MKIAMLGSLGNINRIVVPKLVQAGHDVTVISISPKRQASLKLSAPMPLSVQWLMLISYPPLLLAKMWCTSCFLKWWWSLRRAVVRQNLETDENAGVTNVVTQ